MGMGMRSVIFPPVQHNFSIACVRDVNRQDVPTQALYRVSILNPGPISTVVSFQFDGEGVEAEADGVVDQVLAEIGLDIDGRMLDAPTNAPAIAQPAAKAEEEVKLDSKTEQLLAQLDAL